MSKNSQHIHKHTPSGIRILLGAFGVIAIVMVAFVVWASTPARPMPEALAALVPGVVKVTDSGGWYSFIPTQPDNIAFIIYPGGRVDCRAYAPVAQAIAHQGYPVFLMRMPLNLAVFKPNAADAVIDAHPEIENWAIGGHSLGGAMAAAYAYSHPKVVEGLVLWASYPAEVNDLSSKDIRVISISSSLDGLSTPDKIATSVPLLPPDTIWVVIEGGNHAQFGWYGPQIGDNPAIISREEQQAQIIQATIDFLAAIK